MPKIIIHTDGGARGNPGEAAIGVYIQDEKGKVVAQIGKKIGKTTNNVAEYTAVIEALKWVVLNRSEKLEVRSENLKWDMGRFDRIEFYLDSVLVVQQLNRIFRIKEPHLKDLALQVWDLESEIKIPISYHSVRREQNREADRLVNEALDNKSYLSSRLSSG
ncbi:hypothetical protein A3D77_01275 [Candidatus Gottesmanbacteria bacterium RIFCSPHIGHO2_02_FULL_39_11]|uniref:RNase H type-1 domain-containing protein n=1 Tax=Candidatus Gottesmanbacteria bacterium RIFCSPHIGHO2_02_FULL_39_11 TaxID=1798382 RepID=A0A1F5ZT92_9BACT|nr:MAG: hypothetical protein A3D77_01275 [Candidatus Gottesmanbacteria bacterium RIFCSPHIGHO2_02_FULL_39_11]